MEVRVWPCWVGVDLLGECDHHHWGPKTGESVGWVGATIRQRPCWVGVATLWGGHQDWGEGVALLGGCEGYH